MTAYVIGLSDIHDEDEMNQYRKRVPATLDQYGGGMTLRTVVTEVFEGDMHPDSVVLFEFDSVDDARRWYQSPEYRSAREHRHRSANSLVLLLSSPS